MVHGIGDVEVAGPINDHSRRKIELRTDRHSTIATISSRCRWPLRPTPNCSAQISLLGICAGSWSIIILGKGVFVLKSSQRFWLCDRTHLFDGGRTSDRRDSASDTIYLANQMIFRIGHIHMALLIERQAFWFVQLRL
jgi:hypothetical protein